MYQSRPLTFKVTSLPIFATLMSHKSQTSSCSTAFYSFCLSHKLDLPLILYLWYSSMNTQVIFSEMMMMFMSLFSTFITNTFVLQEVICPDFLSTPDMKWILVVQELPSSLDIPLSSWHVFSCLMSSQWSFSRSLSYVTHRERIRKRLEDFKKWSLV